MELKDFDGRFVEITDVDGLVFRGECEWFPHEYGDLELGKDEEGLQIDNWVFYFSDISRVRVIENSAPPVWMSRPEHFMKLNPVPFELIESGVKTIELRLLDEKRKKIRKGDIIRFENTEDETEVFRVSVADLLIFRSFEDLYSILPLDKCGYTDENIDRASPDDMKKYYSDEQLASHNVVGIIIDPI